MPKRSFGAHLSIWDRLAAAVSNSLTELPALRRDLEILQQALQEIREAKRRQVELRAAAQQATRDLEAAMEKAKEAAVRLSPALVSAYGSKGEKLTEFGLRPWRTRRRKAVPETPQAEENAATPAAKPRKPRRHRPK
jgi:hypothetical protein